MRWVATYDGAEEMLDVQLVTTEAPLMKPIEPAGSTEPPSLEWFWGALLLDIGTGALAA